ncbi:MAG: TIGR02452 family protein [Blautia sp.]
MDRRTKNVDIFKDSVDCMNGNSRLQQAIKKSVNKQKLYLEAEKIDVPDRKGLSCKTMVSTKRSFEAASVYARVGKKVAVLNFASSTNPGGGVTHGSSAQEECLCRCSTLYPCLNIDMMWNKFYKPHRKAGNPLYNDDCLYTPEVIVFKSDISFPERMTEKDWYQVDVITCAAPNLRICRVI